MKNYKQKIRNNKKRLHLGLNCTIGALTLLGSVTTITSCSFRYGPQPEPEFDLNKCVCFENHGDDPEPFSIYHDEWFVEAALPTFTYTLDNGETWLDYDYETITESDPINIQPHSKMYIKGENQYVCYEEGDVGSIKFQFGYNYGGEGSQYITISGSVMGLLDNGFGTLNEIPREYCFNKLFSNNLDIKSVSDDFLPVTTLKPGCYYEMFAYDQFLEETPNLPATILAESCYCGTFRGDDSLIELPNLQHVTECNFQDCLAEFAHTTGGVLSVATIATAPADSTPFFNSPWQGYDEYKDYAQFMFPYGSNPEERTTYCYYLNS